MKYSYFFNIVLILSIYFFSNNSFAYKNDYIYIAKNSQVQLKKENSDDFKHFSSVRSLDVILTVKLVHSFSGLPISGATISVSCPKSSNCSGVMRKSSNINGESIFNFLYVADPGVIGFYTKVFANYAGKEVFTEVFIDNNKPVITLMWSEFAQNNEAKPTQITSDDNKYKEKRHPPKVKIETYHDPIIKKNLEYNSKSIDF